MNVVVEIPLQRSPEVVGRPDTPPSVLALALQLAPREGLRMVRHPVFVAGLLLYVFYLVTISYDGPRAAFDLITTGPTFMTGVFGYFAAHLTATRTRRSHSGELLGALPGGEQARTLALCLAAFVPALVVQVMVLGTYAHQMALDTFVQEPTAAHLVQGPLTVLGGALLGIMVGRWAPYAGVAVVVMVAMIAFDVHVANRPHLAPIGTYMNWPTYGFGEHWYGFEPGNPSWHVTYLALLCAMAATGAMLRSARRPLLVLSVGAVLTGCAVGAALQAVP